MLLAGLLIVETLNFLHLPASSQASEQAARPAIIQASRKARQQSNEPYGTSSNQQSDWAYQEILSRKSNVIHTFENIYLRR